MDIGDESPAIPIKKSIVPPIAMEDPYDTQREVACQIGGPLQEVEGRRTARDVDVHPPQPDVATQELLQRPRIASCPPFRLAAAVSPQRRDDVRACHSVPKATRHAHALASSRRT